MDQGWGEYRLIKPRHYCFIKFKLTIKYYCFSLLD